MGDAVHGRYRWALIFIDAGVIAISLLLAVTLREAVPLPLGPGDVENIILPATPFIGILWLATLAAGGAYRDRRWGVGLLEYRQVFNLSVLFVMALGVVAFMFNYPLSRGFVVILFLIGIPLILLTRLTARRLLQRARTNGKYCTPTLIAGHLDPAEDLVEVLRRESWLGYRPVGLAVDDGETREPSEGVPIVGTHHKVLEAIEASGAHAVIFTSGSVRRGREFNEMARRLEVHRAEMIVVPALTDVAAQRIQTTPVAGLPLMHVGKPQALRSLRLTKRVFDLMGAIALIVLFSPFLLVIALLVKLGDGGPILFRQTRIGVGGEPFAMLKFRSMVPNADELKKQMALQQANDADGALFKIKDDPRVTKVGGFLRRYSIDELPQLFNVVKGDMSLVGPRPALAEEVARYDPHVRRRLDVRPGMTGLWQVSGRSDLSWRDTVRLDLYYVDNWSLLQDLVILMRTFKAVFGSDGAY